MPPTAGISALPLVIGLRVQTTGVFSQITVFERGRAQSALESQENLAAEPSLWAAASLPRVLICSQCGHGAFIKSGRPARSPSITTRRTGSPARGLGAV